MKKEIGKVALILLAFSIAAPAFAQTSGAEIYKAKCAMCHGPDGLAATPMAKKLNVLSFKAPEMMKASDAQFFASTKNGKGKMPGYNGKLTDAQIKDVLSYIRTLQK
ncbi:MAG: cytochrome c [Terracidiphilus sp.]|jgi:mono/diheme cytochrome c family protein